MSFTNTEEKYGLGAKILHWVIAVLILGLLPVGLFMEDMENSPQKFQIFALHKSFGLLVFFLGLARIVWRFVSPPPDHLPNHAHWEITLAGAAHFWLYVCMIGIPLSGWLMSNAGQYPVSFFGVMMPALIGKDESLRHFFGEAHEILALTLLFVLGLHAAGALKHHLVDRDSTLTRMTWRKDGLLIPVIVILLAGISYGASGYAMLFGEEEEKEEKAAVIIPAPLPVEASQVPAKPLTDNLPAHGWAIIPDISALRFEATLNNTPFTGEFKDFDGTIIFNPDDLSTARADITIRMNDVGTGDSYRDSSLTGSEWFDAQKFPVARFVATKFEEADDDNYIAVGKLTIRGKTMPLALPFTLDIDNKTAHVQGEVTLNRTNFGIGQGQWADESSVKHDVRVAIDLKAAQ